MNVAAPKPLKPPAPADLRHRRVRDALIVDMLALQGWGVELAAGWTQQANADAAQLLEAAIDAGAGFVTAADGGRLLDPAEVDHYLSWLNATGVDRRWRERKTLTNGRIVADAKAAHAVHGGRSNARFRIALHRSFDLGHLERGATARLRLPLPLHSTYHETFSFEPVGPAGIGVEWIVSEGRLEARLARPADPLVTIGVDLDLIALPPAARSEPLSERDAELHLRTAEGLIRVTPAIHERSQAVAGSLAPEQAVLALADHIAATLRGGWLRYDEMATDAPLDLIFRDGVVDCKMAAVLLVCLCRARNIPARLVNGYFLYPLAPTSHSWAEIWIDGVGWAPFDGFNREAFLPDRPANPEWWTHFAQRTGDYRLAVERLPLEFTGPMSVRFPPAWQYLQAVGGRGVDLSFLDIATGRLVYRDHVEVTRIG